MSKDAVDILNDQLTVARNEFAAYRCMVEAQIEVMEIVISRLRGICDAAYSMVRDDGAEDGWTSWQELVSALEDANYEPRPASDVQHTHAPWGYAGEWPVDP